jgi:hypothetical protein
MRFRLASILTLSVAALLSLTSCGSQEDIGGSFLEMDVTEGGLILPVDNATCQDKVQGLGARSAAAPSLVFGALRLKWLRTDKSLYVGTIRVTFRSNGIAPSPPIVLTSDEVEALLGAPGGLISPASTADGKSIVSNKSANRSGYPQCSFVVSGFDLANPNQTASFSSSVTIELIGQASGSSDDPEDGSDPQVVRKTYTTTATYY